ncbi:MAG: response regulator [Coleofasciculaceae cyanobacterium]
MDNPLKILLIDDNPDDRTLAVRRLKQEFQNIETEEVTYLAQLEQKLAGGQFDLVITDYQLLWSNGITVLELVKKRYPNCPVIMFTGTGSEEIAVEAMKSGLDDYIIKSPKHYTRLALAVRSALSRAEQRQALREAESRYQELFEGVPIGLYRLNSTGKILEANGTFLEILGYQNLQAVLETELSQYQVDTQNYSSWQHQLNELGVVKNFEMPIRQSNSRVIWVRHHVRALPDKKGTVLYYEGAIEDISDRKQIEAERAELLKKEQKARAEAEKANRLKDEFLATLSHELRTPLNAIVGWSALLRKQKLTPEKTVRAIEIIERNAQSQTQLIEDLLDISRIIRGKLQLNTHIVDLQQIILSALDTLKPAAEAKQIQLQSTLEPATNLVRGDGDRLQQIIWNLLSNAIKFTSMGGCVTVSLQWWNGFAQIQVQDNGKGIPADLVPYIFERFRQVESSSTRTEGGLGLGLAIVRNLVELHGGTVWCESSGLGKGSTFIVQLPVVQESKNPEESDEQANSAATSNALLHNLEVLVVEDEPDSLEFIQMVLEQEGARVRTAHSVREALTLLEQYLPEVLVSDIAMPEEDGYSLIRQVRERVANAKKTIKSLAVTAYARDSDRHRALEAGFQMYLAKPIAPDKLLEAVAQLASRSRKKLQ